MKKRHKQKLVILSIVLLAMFNAPILLLFNQYQEKMGFPVIYIYIFLVWLFSSILSFILFRKYNE